MDVRVEWKGGMEFRGATPLGTVVTMDTHPPQGGADHGPTPMETLLMALAGCSAMDVVPMLQKMRASLERLTIDVSATRATEHPKVLTSAHLRYIAVGRGLSRAQVEKAVALSQEKYCSVSAMLRPAVRITTDVVVEATSAPEATVA